MAEDSSSSHFCVKYVKNIILFPPSQFSSGLDEAQRNCPPQFFLWYLKGDKKKSDSKIKKRGQIRQRKIPSLANKFPERDKSYHLSLHLSPYQHH
jgi:hypothetical protein